MQQKLFTEIPVHVAKEVAVVLMCTDDKRWLLITMLFADDIILLPECERDL